ncbi:hypothetical protein CASFOL_010502 [Castilleja foliolosa]|uniref:C2H2-type domain-containing protein n=1 Tax=Castilleja foliolosa TaxID=1961234 RepID=A0ABD3DUQ4_9LAMI
MSVEMDENGEEHDNPKTDSHVISQYFKVDGAHVGSNEGNNKHSYFLRAKTPRFDKKSLSNNETRSSASCEEEDLANCLVMLSNKSHSLSSDHDKDKEQNKGFKQVVEKGMFQCKACKKIFNSHQALGGHRASHKKVKGCFAAKLDEDEENEEHEPVIPSGPDLTRHVSSMSNKKPKMHECSVCRRVFSSGQALGGHKRCHWLTTSSSTDNTFITSFQDFQYDHHHHQNQQQLFKNPNMSTFVNYARDDDEQDHQHGPLDLNLNLPIADQHHHGDNHGDASSSGFKASSRFYGQEQRITNTDNGNGQKGCEVINKIRKLSDLRDVNYDGGWLQMGIASTADIY